MTNFEKKIDSLYNCAQDHLSAGAFQAWLSYSFGVMSSAILDNDRDMREETTITLLRERYNALRLEMTYER